MSYLPAGRPRSFRGPAKKRGLPRCNREYSLPLEVLCGRFARAALVI